MRVKKDFPPAIVLSFAGTGLATVRCLAELGIEVFCLILNSGLSAPETRFSRYGKKVTVDFSETDDEILCEWLIDFSSKLTRKPVVIPTSDVTALLLSKNYRRLSKHILIWKTSYSNLLSIVSKDRLYSRASRLGINTPPMVIEPGLEKLQEWCDNVSSPYFMKPFFVGIKNCDLQDKNQLFSSKEDLIEFGKTNSFNGLIVQSLIEGGDGHIFDTYGICNKDGACKVLASHLRIRQYSPNFGVTSFGEIPLIDDSELEKLIYDNTLKLLEGLYFHGIFGIEWLRDKITGEIFLLDFNARPFSSIGHLADCGLNLPAISYEELVTEEDPSIDLFPLLEHKYWMDFNNDIRGFNKTKKLSGQSWLQFLKDLSRCSSYAYFKWNDPGPGLYRAFLFLVNTINFFRKKLI